MNTFTIEGQLRSDMGKKGARAVRSEEKVPCVIYGGAQTLHFSAPVKAFKHLVYSPDFQLVEIKLDGKVYKCILKDLQFHKVTDELLHIDFLELVEGKKVLANVPLKYVGTSKGVKEGGRLIVKVKTIKVKCLPSALKESIEVSIADLEIGKNLRIEDIKAENMEIMQSPRIPIASVVTTRALKQAEAEAAKK